MGYKLGQTVNRERKSIKKYIAGAVVSVVATAGMAIPAMAAGNSTPGIDRYNNNPGRQQATEVGAQCGSGAGSGAFGYFGKDNNLSGGADGPATGDANSSICGNPNANP